VEHVLLSGQIRAPAALGEAMSDLDSAMSPDERAVHEALDRLGIAFDRYVHPPVFTVEEAEAHWSAIPATHCKNLFLRNKKGDVHYLVVVAHTKRVDLKALAVELGADKVSFASAERLQRHLGLTAGAVSPFGLIHDRDRSVRLVLDGDLKGAARIAFHPNVNTATIAVGFEDFIRFVESTGHSVKFVRV
jgi:Ala-tRNA(Pro) deacylase